MAVAESEKIQEVKKISSTDPNKATQLYKDIITNNSKTAVINDAQSREFESALLSLGELYRDQKWAQKLVYPAQCQLTYLH